MEHKARSGKIGEAIAGEQASGGRLGQVLSVRWKLTSWGGQYISGQNWPALFHRDLPSQMPEEADGSHSALTLGCPGTLPVLLEEARVAQTRLPCSRLDFFILPNKMRAAEKQVGSALEGAFLGFHSFVCGGLLRAFEAVYTRGQILSPYAAVT